jgi:hypothetical protein
MTNEERENIEEVEIPEFLSKKIKNYHATPKKFDEPTKYEEVEYTEGSIGAEIDSLGYDLNEMGKLLEELEIKLKPILAVGVEHVQETEKMRETNTSLASKIRDERMKAKDFCFNIREIIDRIDL